MKQLMRMAGSIALLGIFVAASNGVAQDKMRLGLSSVSALHSAVWIAEQKGLFASTASRRR
jgi:ABC-type nitrate/sulfonate/bicarbonate transport system substrate-binding protein